MDYEGLQEGTEYRYANLMAGLEGGSRQFYLPYRGQTVYAAFLNPAKNPDAPRTILVGSRPRVAAAGAMLSRQVAAIPIFVKRGKDRWIYNGRFVAAEVLGPGETKALAKAADRDDVAFALTLRKIDEACRTDQKSVYLEGACGQVTTNVYERDPAAREACLAHHGRRCCVCGVDFGEEYGERGADFIHVHHLVPLSARGGVAPTDPVKDLRPVCANCHAMLHRGELMDPDALRALYLSGTGIEARRKRISAEAG